MEKHKEVLSKYLPPETVDEILHFIVAEKVAFKITRERKRLKGSYIPPKYKLSAHTVTVNNNLSVYEFLWVTIHEFAHLQVWKKYGHKVLPHGIEWKQEFNALMTSFFGRNIFPQDLEVVLKQHLLNPSASANRDNILVKAFHKYENKSEREHEERELSSLPLNTRFILQGQNFVLLTKRRTRYLCKSLENGKNYLVSGSAYVLPFIE